MGGANNICSDKTGTLTKNKMTLVQVWAGQSKSVPNPDGELTDKLDTSQFCNNSILQLLGEAISVNTEDTLENSGATEKAMLKFIIRSGFDYLKLRQDLPQVHRFLFDSGRKRMSTIVKTKEGNNRVHIKGASEIVLESCTHYLDASGAKQPIDDQMKNQLLGQIKDFAKMALRTIAFAYKDLEPGLGGPNHEDVVAGTKIGVVEEADNTLIAIVGIMDIIREEVPEAVSKCNFAGVRVRMVTGDNKVTAIAIAKQCGILAENEGDEECVCMEGPEFYNFVGKFIYKDTGEEVLVQGKEDRKE